MISPSLDAQLFKKKKKDKAEKAEESSKKEGEFLKKCVKIEGLFDLYQDTTNGSAYLAVKKDQLDEEFIYFSYSENGPIDTWHVKGLFQENKIFQIRKHYEHLEFVTPNSAYYYDTTLAISRSQGANTSEAIWAKLKIEKTEGETYYVKADELFLSEKVAMIKPPPPQNTNGRKFFQLGNLSKEKTKYHDLRNYPENTEILVDYVFDNGSPQVWGTSAVTDARYVTVRYQHSFLKMPDDGYETRADDSRVGFFLTQMNDLTGNDYTPYRDMIHRWRLVKKDPEAALSEPVKPIIYWMENTTPIAWRPTIKAAVEKWNVAFETAGFKNAIVVKQQPDDADWDAGDIRYNVLRWSSSPLPPWGGYGPSFVNPRTGEILGADIMLEYSFVFNHISQENLFGMGGGAENFNTLFSEMPNKSHCGKQCIAGHLLAANNQMGAAYLGESPTDVGDSEFLQQALTYLIMHEVGHTLGLAHNMKSSHLHSPSQAHDKERTSEMGLYGSVMEYPMVNLAVDKSQQGHFYTTRSGPYDSWAIQFGYDPDLKDAEKMEAHLARSTEPELLFGNDADDMRSPGSGIDPRVMIFDMTSDPLSYGEQRVQIVNNLMPSFLEKFRREGENYDELYRMYRIATWQQFMAMNAVSRYVGGVYQDRGNFGQEGAGQPLTPVDYETQKKAMRLLQQYLLAPDAVQTPEELYPYMVRQRRGWEHWSNNEDPQIHDRMRFFHAIVFSHLMHPKTLKRITDTRLYGNKYSALEMLNDLTDGIFKADLGGSVNSFRQIMQLDYVAKLLLLLEKKSVDGIALSAVLAQVQSIKKMLKSSPGSGETAAHRAHVLLNIEKALKTN